jgi:glycosyltransferase involved in cell wall biosynthesis
MSKIGVLLPAYNEEKNIRIVINEAKRFLPNSKIVVVDDGSIDKTYELAKKTGVTVIRHEVNRGKGEALKTGFNFFSKVYVDYVIVADTDRQYRLEDATKILEALENQKADYVTGYRIPSDVPFANRVGNFIWRKLFNFFFGLKLKDSNCGFIGLNRNALKKIRNIHGGYIIENSMLIDCVRNNLKVVQVPVKVFYGKRKIRKFAKMFFGVLIFILIEGFKYRLGIK